jgi:hypothetical protein
MPICFDRNWKTFNPLIWQGGGQAPFIFRVKGEIEQQQQQQQPRKQNKKKVKQQEKKKK